MTRIIMVPSLTASQLNRSTVRSLWGGDGHYTYTPKGGYVGADSFTYTIRGLMWAYATGTVNINVVNQPPVANTDSYTVHASLNTNPMQNDTDPDGDGILFVSIATQPQHGTIAYNKFRPVVDMEFESGADAKEIAKKLRRRGRHGLIQQTVRKRSDGFMAYHATLGKSWNF